MHYVDKLFETEGSTPTQTERNELVDSLEHCSFTVGCPTRVNVLRKIIEHPAFDRKVFNEAFVTMEYFGYLGRDPDVEGFQFWLAKLNEFNGDFIQAEMVRALSHQANTATASNPLDYCFCLAPLAS